MDWLTEPLRQEVRRVFEPRYKRPLTDAEVEDIANNLTGYMEAILKFTAKQKEKKGAEDLKNTAAKK